MIPVRSYSYLNLFVGSHLVVKLTSPSTLRNAVIGTTKRAINYTSSVTTLAHGVVLVSHQVLGGTRSRVSFLPKLKLLFLSRIF